MPLNRGNSRSPGDTFGRNFQEACSIIASAASSTDFSVVYSSTVLPTHYFAIIDIDRYFDYIIVYCIVVSQQFVVIMLIFLAVRVNLALIKTAWRRGDKFTQVVYRSLPGTVLKVIQSKQIQHQVDYL